MTDKKYLSDFDFVSRLPVKEYEVKTDKKNRSIDFVAPYGSSKIYCHATFKTSGKLNRIEVELKDVYEKYGTSQEIAKWVIGVKDKVSFTWIKKGRICFAFEPKDDVIVFDDYPSDCLSLVDLFVEQMNDYTNLNIKDPFSGDFQFEYSLKSLKSDKISSLVFTIIMLAVSVFAVALIFVQVANDSIAGIVCFAIIAVIAIGLVLKFLKDFLTAKKDFEKVDSMKIKYKNSK